MPKPKIHPTWSKNSPVFCDGKLLCYLGSTKQQLNVDIWLKNHPFLLEIGDGSPLEWVLRC